MKAQPSHPPANKPEPTAEELYKSNRLTLIRKLVDQMIKRKGRLTVPRLDSRQLEELKTSGSPILWLKAQPEYEAVFKARNLAEHQATSPVSKKTAQHTRKKKKRGKKQKLVKDVVPSESKTKKGQPKKKRVRQYSDPYEKPTRPVTPLSDAPVSYILRQLDKAGVDANGPNKIDWDST